MAHAPRRISALIDRLKRDAKRLGKQDGIPHHAALRKIAEREGFKSWEELSRAASGVSAEDFEQCE
jgi:hypothetical protein